MKKRRISYLLLVALLSLLLISGIQSTMAGAKNPTNSGLNQIQAPTGGGDPGDVDNWFSYQGYLEDNGTPINDFCDFEFSLWDSSGTGEPPVGGIQIGVTETLPGLLVSDGLFSYPLNASNSFGDGAFNGQRRYLQIAVRCPINSGAYTTLAPRQLLTASPYALSLRPGTVVSATQNNAIFTVINMEDTNTHGGAITSRSSAPTAPTIAANHTGIGHALYGSSNSGYPTIGGVNSGTGNAVDGRSTSGIGVYGFTSSASQMGVVGLQTGYSTSDLGLWWKPGGFFGGRNGVVGVTKANSGYGVFGIDLSTFGGWAGYFKSENGSGVYASVPSGNVGLNTNGTKPAVVATDEGARLMYAEESTEVWFSEYGFGQLEAGLATIAIDPLFAQTVNLNEPYHVFLQTYGNAELYVNNRTAAGFEVHLREGDPNVEFSYRIVATRLGYEGTRLEAAPWADNDPNLYPDKANDASTFTAGNATMKRLLILLLLLAALLGASVVFASPDIINQSWWTVDGGGPMPKTSGGSYSLQGTAGQADAGLHSNGSYTLQGGYWNTSISKIEYEIYLPLVVKP